MTTTSRPHIDPADYERSTGNWYCEYPVDPPRPRSWVRSDGRTLGAYCTEGWCNDVAHWQRIGGVYRANAVNYVCDAHLKSRMMNDDDYNK